MPSSSLEIIDENDGSISTASGKYTPDFRSGELENTPRSDVAAGPSTAPESSIYQRECPPVSIHADDDLLVFNEDTLANLDQKRKQQPETIYISDGEEGPELEDLSKKYRMNNVFHQLLERISTPIAQSMQGQPIFVSDSHSTPVVIDMSRNSEESEDDYLMYNDDESESDDGSQDDDSSESDEDDLDDGANRSHQNINLNDFRYDFDQLNRFSPADHLWMYPRPNPPIRQNHSFWHEPYSALPFLGSEGNIHSLPLPHQRPPASLMQQKTQPLLSFMNITMGLNTIASIMGGQGPSSAETAPTQPDPNADPQDRNATEGRHKRPRTRVSQSSAPTRIRTFPQRSFPESDYLPPMPFHLGTHSTASTSSIAPPIGREFPVRHPTARKAASAPKATSRNTQPQPLSQPQLQPESQADVTSHLPTEHHPPEHNADPTQQAVVSEKATKEKGSVSVESIKCPICMEAPDPIYVTTCGHVFCKTCIEAAITEQKRCPICRTGLRKNKIHPIFL
eukprot:TRINITY_DN6010_c0_g1_i10.p1 TRINITY_DN6010_c0_g1~~TRINITY_DN6010_c0_g1_i10.p1  ORF type:complete len:509 (-),score=68.66 TRINITY_DN6010_c0_g1_i10:390-1916(-)